MSHSHPPNRWLHKGLAAGALIGLMGVNLLASGSAGVARTTLTNGQTLTRSLNAPNIVQNVFGPSGPTSPSKPYGAEVILPSGFGSVASHAEATRVHLASPQPRVEEDLNILPKTLVGSQKVGPDGALQDTPGTADALNAPIANFDGLTITESGGFLPPDTNGDIGYDPGTGKRYYFEWVNVFYKAWDVTNPLSPVVVISATAGNTLWAAALPGTGCANNNDGDPVVLFDEQAHRWMITQFDLGPSFSGPFHQCIAVSKTPDPTGAWWVYQYNYRDAATYLNDYPHFGVWPDATYNAYYMTVHQFNASGTAWLGQAVGAFDRAKLLAGDSSSPLVVFDLFTVNQNFGGMLPADLDGNPPPAGTPGLFFEVDDDTAGMGADALRIWEFRPNWATPASSTFGISGQPNYTLTVSSFNLLPCTTNGSRSCIPQSGTAQGLDAIGDRLMHRVAFRQVGNTQSAIFNHTVWADGTNRAGVRWYEARRDSSTGTWSINQQGTYAPTDGMYRWMGSAAMDSSGNIAVGYSASNSSSFPSIRYAGRAAADPLNTLPQAEQVIITSTGSQTHSAARWGDYAMLGVDPQDGCTFWFSEEYHGATASSAWRTRIASFRFDQCGSTDFYLNPQTTTQNICQGTTANYTIGVGSIGGFNSPVTMSISGNPGSASFVPNPVTPPVDGITNTLLSISGAAAGNYTFPVTGTSGLTSHATSLQLNVVGGIAGVPTLVGPANGASDIAPNATLTWTASAGAATYYLEVATDPGFSTIVYTATVAGTTHTTSALAANTTYYWRVRTANICGNSSFSTPFSFTTASLSYQTVCATPNQAIADNTTVTTTLNVPTGGTLIDLDVIITATHTWVGDLTFTVTKGANQSMIVDRPGYAGSGFGCSNDNVGAQLNDEGTDGPVENQCRATAPALFGQPTPNNPLSIFDGQSLAGTWSLAVRDSASGDTGTLQSWCLVGTVSVPSGPSANLTLEKTVGTNPAVCGTSDSVTIGYGDSVTYCYKATNTGNISLTTHSLVDNRLGTLLNNQSITLPPLASTFFTTTTALTTTTVNSATWTASYLTYTVSSSDVATVTVVATPTIVLSTNAIAANQAPNTVATRTLLITNTGLGSLLDWNIIESTSLLNPVATASTGTAFAPDAKVAPAVVGRANPTYQPNPETVLLTEGFEGGTVPPTGWTQVTTNSGYTWKVATVGTAHGGTKMADVEYDPGLANQDEWLVSPVFNLSSGTLSLWSYGSIYWCRDTFNNCDLEVWLIVGAPGGSDDIYVGEADPDWSASFVWSQSSFDLGSFLPGGPVRIGLRYSGVDGAQVAVDDIVLDGVEGATCAGDIPWLAVTPMSGTTAGGTASPVSLIFDTTGLTAGNTYTGTLCINSNAAGQPQVTVPITLNVGGTYSVSVLPVTTALTGSIGTSVMYPVWITNTGSVTDTFDIGVSNSPAFTTSVTSPVGPLGPGQSTQVWITVQIPAGVAHGTTSTANIFVSSQGGSASANFTLITTAARRIYLPIIRK